MNSVFLETGSCYVAQIDSVSLCPVILVLLTDGVAGNVAYRQHLPGMCKVLSVIFSTIGEGRAGRKGEMRGEEN